ncbi:MAG: DNA repair protein RecO [Candidatus Marinimicrobia bacterium]|nr:DNA repair protein RecO [Candidatus Neomarinimicrobiota bacterium]MCF7839357.1 DNA repair protein RecO [Candidatus Neomarinimicrobiota bacterium]
MIRKAEAVVLKTINQGETSKIATLYTREFGRLKIIAKGIRSKKSRYMGLLGITQHIQLVFYEKHNTELQLFKSGEIVRTYNALNQDFDRLAFAQVAMEFIERTAEKTEPHPELFDLVVWILTHLNDPDIPAVKCYWYFHLRCLCELGFRPDVFRCHQCKRTFSRAEAVYHQPDGGVYCVTCSPTLDERFSLRLSPTVMSLLQAIDAEEWGVVKKTSPALADRRTIWSFIWHYSKVHLEPLQRMKSLAVLEQIYRGGH